MPHQQDRDSGSRGFRDHRGLALLLACTVLLAALPAAAAAEARPPRPQSRDAETTWGVLMAAQGAVQQAQGFNGSFVVAPNVVLPGMLITPGEGNPQPTIEACAQSCINVWNCSVFNFCPTSSPGGTCAISITGNPPLPAGACELRMQQAVVDGTSITLLGVSPDIQVVAGAPLAVSNLSVPGFDSWTGLSVQGAAQLQCQGSLRDDVCALPGSAQDLAAACLSRPDCQAIVFVPQGTAASGNASVGLLKGRPGQLAASSPLDSSQMNWNPRAVLLVRAGVTVKEVDKLAAAGGGSGASTPPAAASGAPGSQAWGLLTWGQAQLSPESANGSSSGYFIQADHALLAGQDLNPDGQRAVLPTAGACSQACRSTPRCTSFNWCPAAGPTCTLDLIGLDPLPPGGCQLLNDATSADGNGILVLTQGPSVPTTGGSPVTVFNVSLPGFHSFLGEAMPGAQQITCPGSVRDDACQLLGDAQTLHAACEANPDCQAIAFYPRGRYGQAAPQGTLKGARGDSRGALLLSHVKWNPSTVLLVRQGVPLLEDADAPPAQQAGGGGGSGGSSSDGGSGLSTGAIAGIAVGSLAAALLAAGAATLLAVRRRERLRREAGGSDKSSSDSLGRSSAPRPLLPIADKRAASGADTFQIETAVASDPTLLPAGGSSAIVPGTSPLRVALSSPRHRGGPPASPTGFGAAQPFAAAAHGWLPGLGAGQEAAAAAGGQQAGTGAAAGIGSQESGGAAGGQPGSPRAAADGETASPASGSPTAASDITATVPALAWAADMLSQAAQGWEEALVQESEIVFLTGPDGRPISLGSGGFGSVYKVLLGGYTMCAAKVVEWRGRQHSQIEFVQEAVMLKRLRHPNIVAFLAASVTDERGILCMEFASGRDLDAAMNARSRANGARLFDWYNRGRRVAVDIASGLAYLHHCRVLHLDIKPHNVLLSRDGVAKLGDVGFARLMSRTHLTIDGQYGTFDWCSPEVLMGQGATYKSDIFSFGILLWELCSGTRPRRGQLTPLRSPEQCPAEVSALQQACTCPDPNDRPSAEEVLRVLMSLPAGGRPPEAPQPARPLHVRPPRPVPPPLPVAGGAPAAERAAAEEPGMPDTPFTAAAEALVAQEEGLAAGPAPGPAAEAPVSQPSVKRAGSVQMGPYAGPPSPFAMSPAPSLSAPPAAGLAGAAAGSAAGPTSGPQTPEVGAGLAAPPSGQDLARMQSPPRISPRTSHGTSSNETAPTVRGFRNESSQALPVGSSLHGSVAGAVSDATPRDSPVPEASLLEPSP